MEAWGYTNLDLYLYHIKEDIQKYRIPYLKQEAEKMLIHSYKNR